MTSSLATKRIHVVNPIQPKEITMIVESVSTKWLHIGILLGIPIDRLKSIELDYVHAQTRCCMEMLQYWLNSRDSTADDGREQLSRALREVGHQSLADMIPIGTIDGDAVLLK